MHRPLEHQGYSYAMNTSIIRIQGRSLAECLARLLLVPNRAKLVRDKVFKTLEVQVYGPKKRQPLFKPNSFCSCPAV